MQLVSETLSCDRVRDYRRMWLKRDIRNDPENSLLLECIDPRLYEIIRSECIIRYYYSHSFLHILGDFIRRKDFFRSNSHWDERITHDASAQCLLRCVKYKYKIQNSVFYKV